MMLCDDASTEVQPVRRLEVFTGAGRRRHWSDSDKAAIVAESYSGTGTVCDVARRHGLASGQLFSWRRQLRQPIDDAAAPAAAPMFVPALVEVSPAPIAAPTPRPTAKRARKSRTVPMVEVMSRLVRRKRGFQVLRVGEQRGAYGGSAVGRRHGLA